MKAAKKSGIVSGLAIAACIATSAIAAERGGLDETGPYTPVENWFKPGVRWNQPITGMAIDTPNRILIACADEHIARPGSLVIGADGVPERPQRPMGGETPKEAAPAPEKTHLHMVMALDAEGKVVEDWSQWNDTIVLAHNIFISPYDKERHVWVVDREGQQILKFSNDGKKLVMKLGEKGVAGTDHGHFNLPAGMAFLPDGSFLVADGYRNTRVVKFDKDGKFVMEFGAKGTGHGEFNLVHSVAVDAKGRIYVADRGNNRIQMFDETGKYLDEWDNIRSPAFMMVSADGKSLWVTSNADDRLAKFDMNGTLQTVYGTKGSAFAGGIDDLHYFQVDKSGNLYIADSFNNRIQKWVPKPDADKARLVDQPLLLSK